MTDSNFGTLISIAGIANMKVVSIGAPVMQMGTIETTNHSSGDWRQYIADNLRSIKSFKVTVEANEAIVAAVYAVWNAHVPVACVFTEYNIPAWSFDAAILSFDLGTADAKKPDEETVVIEIQPTGTVTVAAAATNWYDSVTALYTDVGGAYTIDDPGTHQLVVYAVVPGLPPTELSAAQLLDLTFDSTETGKATVSTSPAAAGLITTVDPGDTVITIILTSDPTVNTTILVTVT
jgi:hypothetical protein